MSKLIDWFGALEIEEVMMLLLVPFLFVGLIGLLILTATGK